MQDHVLSQWVEATLGRKAAITDVSAALQQVRFSRSLSQPRSSNVTLSQCLKPSAGPLLARCCHSLQPIDLARMTQVHKRCEPAHPARSASLTVALVLGVPIDRLPLSGSSSACNRVAVFSFFDGV